MARSFNGTTDRIVATDAASLSNLSPLVIWAWVFPVGWGGNNHGTIASKGWNGLVLADNESLIAGTGATTTFCAFVSHDVAGSPNGAPAVAASGTLSLGQWWFLAMKFTPSAGGCRLYRGSETAAVAEVASYATRQAESGPRESDTGFDLTIGNTSGLDRGVNGRIGPMGELGGVDISATQLEVIRRFTYTARGRHAWGGLWMMDEATGDMRDFSGNGNLGDTMGTTWIKGPTITRRPVVV